MINWELIGAQAVGLTIIVGAVWTIVRAIRQTKSNPSAPTPSPGPLEKRVRVLERIATDRSIELADEIESLRDEPLESRKSGGSA